MKKVMLLLLFLPLFVTSSAFAATNTADINIVPSVHCLSSNPCTTNIPSSAVPSTTTPSNTSISGEPTSTLSVAPSINPSPTATSPCSTSQASVSTQSTQNLNSGKVAGAKIHISGQEGFLQQLFQLLLQLILLILQQIGVQIPNTGVVTPCPTRTPSTSPSLSPSSLPASTPTSTIGGATQTPINTQVPVNTSAKEDIISTLYTSPTSSPWTQVESAAPTVSYAIVDICAPDGSGSGCNGSPADEQATIWNPTINALKSAGITPLYYISSGYGKPALSVLEGEIQKAITWYGTPSPMFDEMEPSGTCSNGGNSMSCATYYSDLYTYAVNAGATVVMYNPGTSFGTSSADMFGTHEILQVFEGTAQSFESTKFPSWMSSYPAKEFSATISVGTSSTIGTDVNDAVKDNIGNFYEDDEAETPNYATLPTFWTTEVNDVKSAK